MTPRVGLLKISWIWCGGWIFCWRNCLVSTSLGARNVGQCQKICSTSWDEEGDRNDMKDHELCCIYVDLRLVSSDCFWFWRRWQWPLGLYQKSGTMVWIVVHQSAESIFCLCCVLVTLKIWSSFPDTFFLLWGRNPNEEPCRLWEYLARWRFSLSSLLSRFLECHSEKVSIQ